MGGVRQDDLARVDPRGAVCVDTRWGAELVVLGYHQHLGPRVVRAPRYRSLRGDAQGRGDQQPSFDASIVDGGGHQCSERVARQPDRNLTVTSRDVVACCDHVLRLQRPSGVPPLRLTGAAEVETHRAGTGLASRSPHRIDDVMVAIPAVQGVRMGDDHTHGDRIVVDHVGGQVHAVGRGQGHGFDPHHVHGTVPAMSPSDDKLPIKMLNDRLLVRMPEKEGERRSMGGILIPATAQLSKRLVWAEVVALGQNVRAAEVGDQVLFSPEDRYEVEVQGVDYIMLRERDLHAVAASRIDGHTGLYL